MSKSIRRRRLEKKTDYKSRLALLKSGRNRLVIRKTNRYLIVQIVESNISQDKVIFSVTSKDLIKNGWPENLKGSLKSLQAAYLTGLLAGKLINDKGKNLIVDLGMYRNVKKSRLYSLVKGLIDSGVELPVSEKVLPTLDELKSNVKNVKVFEEVRSKL